MDNLTGEILDGRYSLDSLLGEGGMGQVYVGTQVMTGRRVAVKFLLPELSNNKEAVDRFYREAKAATAIGSDHICEVIDMRPPEAGAPFLVMEYLDGETLKDRLTRAGKLSVEDTVNVMLQVLEALYAAHKAGIVHRDIKPENVFLVDRGPEKPVLVKLLDFGISKFNPQEGGEDHSLTRTGTVLGTPYYMSPEQASGDRSVGPQSDLYAVGVMLYEVITGSVPFDAESFSALVVKIVTEVPLHPCQRDPSLPQAMGDLIMKSMARSAQYRFSTAKEMAEALRAVATGQAIDIVPVHATDASFEAVQVAGSSGISNAFPRTQIQHGGSGVSGYSGTSGETQTPMNFSRTGETAPRTWLFVGGGALVMVLLIAGVGGFFILPKLFEESPPPPPPVVTSPSNQGDNPSDQTTNVASSVPTEAADASPGNSADAASSSPITPEPTTITVTYAIAPSKVTVYLDDRELEAGPAGSVELPADGASHVIKATASGHREESREFMATEDRRIAFTLTPNRRVSTSSSSTRPTKSTQTTTRPTKTTTRPTKRNSGVVTGVVTPAGWD